MAYNVSYTSLPTFTANSIGYYQDASGNVIFPANVPGFSTTVNIFFITNPGIYTVSINISQLPQVPLGIWSGGLSGVSESIDTIYVTTGNNVTSSSINFTTTISVTPPNGQTIFVNIVQSDTFTASTPSSYYNTITRIA